MHVVILGNGISGITAARHIRKQSEATITVISSETAHFFSRTALMYIYMGHMRYEHTKPYADEFWAKNRINLKQARVSRVDFKEKSLHFEGSTEASLAYDKLILAVGSTPNRFGWPGQDLERVQGLYAYQDVEQMEHWTKRGIKQAVIVGGGLIGVEMAEMFHARHIPVHFLVRESSYWSNVLPKEESEMVSRHIRAQGIDLHLETELKEIVDDGSGHACAVRTSKEEEIPCQFVGLTAGVRPNIEFLRGTDLELGRGILVDSYLRTNIEDVYAVGDCAELKNPTAGRRSIEAIWYTGRMMGETVAYTICGTPTKYVPRMWFNSAKFFDMEYQVYGDVQARPPESQASLFWAHADGQKSIRIVYDRATKAVLGFNLMGVRYRHEVCERWIASGTPLKDVLTQLSLANFDPEFFKMYEKELIEIYNRQAPSSEQVQLKSKRSLNQVLRFLRS